MEFNRVVKRTALVTGGARRIGCAIVRHLHAQGFAIALHYRHSSEEAHALAGELNSGRPNSCDLFQSDLDDPESVSALGAALREKYDSLTLLVNNASSFSPTPLSTATPADVDRMLDSNLRAPYFLTQKLLPLLHSGSSIVNIVDVHTERPLENFNAYCAAKAGLQSLTRSFAVELAPEIRVNAVAPGAILWPDDDAAYDAAARKRTITATPLQRLGSPEDIAKTVYFLASHAPFITGQVITVDGGRSLTF